MAKPYSIMTPPFEVTSGGIRVMWGLYGWLLAKGQIAQVNTIFDTPSIGIYPEIFHANPANAKTVVRYILQKPGLAAMYGKLGPTSFKPTDRMYYFSKLYAPSDVKDNQIMFLPICNLHLFKDQKKNRTKTCVLTGKGLNTNVHPKDAIKIDRELANDQQVLADLLNECHTMYSYDPVTAMFEIARLCGCRVVVIPPDDERFKFDLKEYEPGMNGISIGLDEIVPLDIEEFRGHYEEMVLEFSDKLDQFIDDTQHD